MTRNLDRFESRGLVKRRIHQSDRRRVEVELTRKGRALAEKKLRVEVASLDALLEGLGATEKRSLMVMLDGLIAGLAESIEAVCGASKAAVNVLSESARPESQGKIKRTTIRLTGVPGTGLTSDVIYRAAALGTG